MGAELLGVLMKGPARIDIEGKREACEKRVYVIRAWAERCAEIYETTDDGEYPEPPAWIEVDDCEKAPFLRFLGPDLDHLLHNLDAVWNQKEANDQDWRPDPDDPSQILMYCGAASWGDEPDGFGYETMRQTFRLGLNDLFGIR